MMEVANLKRPYFKLLETEGVLFPDDDDVLTDNIRNAIISGRFEAEEAAQLPNVIRPGDRILEIGAGLGFISTLASRQADVECVIAVEANPLLMDYMQRLHRLNDVSCVDRRNTVLTNSPEAAMTFYLRRDFWMGSLLSGPNPYYDTVDVPTTSFNALLRDEQISLIICDVEGAETSLFDDADLSSVDRVYLEVHDHVTGLSGIGHLFSTFAAKGFVFDPRHSSGSIILFQKLGDTDILRPYSG